MSALACFIVLLFAPHLGAEVSIVAPHITGLINENQSGPYQKILKEAALRAGITYQELAVPEKRAVNMFTSKKADCMYSYTSIMEAEFGKENILTSFPIGVYKEYMFTKKGTQALTSINQLRGKTVSATLGTEGWHEKIDKAGIKIEYIADDVQSIRMLEADRIEVFLGFLPDVTDYLERLKYAPEYPLVTDYDRITCHKSSQSEAFIKAISRQLKAMKKDGSTAAFLGRLFVEFNEHSLSE